MGIRYGLDIHSSKLENMPHPARVAIHNSIRIFSGTDRGLVRNSNDRTMDTRAACFRDWLCSSGGYRNVAQLSSLNNIQAVALLGAYIDHIATTPYNRQGALPMANTLNHYLTAATRFLAHYSPTVNVYPSITGGPARLHPALAARIELRRKWQKPWGKT
jgi:hypothetical protein